MLVYRYGISARPLFSEPLDCAEFSTEREGLVSRAFMSGDRGTVFENLSLDRVIWTEDAASALHACSAVEFRCRGTPPYKLPHNRWST
jgi:hypothetical protein